MVARVDVKKEILLWAYNRSGKKDTLFVKFPKLNDWLKGELQPTLNQLEEFSRATFTPLGYFFLKEIPKIEIPVPHFRTLEDGEPSDASPDLIETLHTMQGRQDFLKSYFEEFVGEKLPFVGAELGKNAVEIAEEIRNLLNLELRWFNKVKSPHDALKYLVNKCEENRITVMIYGTVGNNTHRKLNVKEFRGFVLVDEVAPFVFINGADAKAAQVFTLIHELAHILIGKSAIVEASPLENIDNDFEKLCNAVAVEFLCPKNIFVEEWKNHLRNENIYIELGDLFKVSPIVIGRRAWDLKFIDRQSFFEFYNQYLAELEKLKEIPKKSGGNFYDSTKIKLGELFTRSVVSQMKTGKIQYIDAYRLTGLKRTTFHEYIDRFERGGE